MTPQINQNFATGIPEGDRIAKKKIVSEVLANYCCSYDDESLHYDDLKQIRAMLLNGSGKLVLTSLSGGYTNYTYKASCISCPTERGNNPDEEGKPEVAVNLFVKLCFPRAFWNPDPTYHYDVERVSNEAIIMETFLDIAPGCVAKPYLLVDVGDMKLLATEWSAKAEEQLGNQFIDGLADLRVAIGLAKAMAALHKSESMNDDFNTEARECMIDLFPELRKGLLESVQSKLTRTDQLAAEYGEDLCHMIWDEAEKSYRCKELPVHADLHAFNILVESKPDISALGPFGKDGAFNICDWEMAMVGPLGVDMGRIYSIPVACIIAHTLNGNKHVEKEFLYYMDTMWDVYKKEMRKDRKKDDVFLNQSYRNTLAWLGWKLYGMSQVGWFISFLPIYKAADVDTLKDCVGVIGLKLMRLGFLEEEPDWTSQELQIRLSSIIHEEVELIDKRRFARDARAPIATKRSSMLRTKNRRVSDGFQKFRQGSISEELRDHLDWLDMADDEPRIKHAL